MKTITLLLDKLPGEPRSIAYELSQGVTTQEFLQFKLDYKYFIQREIGGLNKASRRHKFDLENLPELSSDFEQLKKLMSIARTVEEWNTLREGYKFEFIFPVIAELDASGFINKVIKNK